MAKTDEARIPVEQLTAFERWELPLLDEEGNRLVVNEVDNKALTVEQLETIRQNGYQAGFEQGSAEGYEEGHESGLV